MEKENSATSRQEQTPGEIKLEQLRAESLAKLKNEYSPEKTAGKFNLEFTLFEHLLTGSTVEGQGLLDKNTPITVLAGGNLEDAIKARKKVFEETGGFDLSIQTGPKVIFHFILKLKDPGAATTIENVDFEESVATNRSDGKQLADGKKKKNIIVNYFSKAEQRWQEKQDEKLKERA